MDIDLPLILMIAVSVTGAIWLLDAIFWAKPRKKAAREVDDRFEQLGETDKQNDEGYQRAMEAATREPLLVEYSKSFFPILALVFVLRSFLIEPFQIPSESMLPTLEVGDFIAVNKFSYGIRLPVFRTKVMEIGQPDRGDVVVFFPPHENRYFIKRLVGLPGDTIRYEGQTLYINGVPTEQTLTGFDEIQRPGGGACWGEYGVMEETIDESSHLVRKCLQSARAIGEGVWEVPAGHYFMMGDNRENSLDSRSWPDPYVPDENIVGKAFAIWMHWDKWPTFQRAGKIR